MAGAKRKYIEAAYELLERDGLEGVSIRKVADEVGCSSTALYRHFPDIEKLVAVASIRFLRDYIEDARILSKVDLNPLELNLQLWECLAYYSFRNPDIYDNLFFGRTADELYSAAVKEYYQEYPEDFSGLKDFMLEMFTNATIAERDGILLNRAVEMGMLSQESADYLMKIDSYLYSGVLASLRGRSMDEAAIRDMTHEFMQLLIRSYTTQLEAGYSILVVSSDFVPGNANLADDARSSFRVEFKAQTGGGPKRRRGKETA